MKYTKMHGAGNDFILLDNMDGSIPETSYSPLARDLCRRRLSVGADGLIVILPAQEDGDYSMRFYNSDGSLGEMCGNGARCVARYGHDHGYAGDIQRIETTAGLVIGQRIDNDLYCVRLNDPTKLEMQIGIPWEGRIIFCSYVELGKPGIPHAVAELEDWDELETESLRDLGKLIRYWPTFPHGANVTFWKQTGQNHVKVVTYERGVEDFTLACGTGAGSTAYVLRKLGIAEPGVVQLDFPGGELQVSLIEEEDRITDLYLTGPAAVVSVGECFPSP